MALYRKEELDDMFIAEAKKQNDAKIAAIERNVKAHGAVRKPDHETNSKPDARKVLATMMMLGMMADQITGNSYMDETEGGA